MWRQHNLLINFLMGSFWAGLERSPHAIKRFCVDNCFSRIFTDLYFQLLGYLAFSQYGVLLV